ncbi:MAG: DUF4056 domain-containing protein [Polyangiaceae bacterium]
MLRRALIASLSLLATSQMGCVARAWSVAPAALVSEQQVSAALGEPPGDNAPFDAASLMKVGPPRRVRPCCAFGMDLGITVADVSVPGYSVENIISLKDLGRHEYDNGAVTVNQNLARLATLEKNGLVYTCRGGFVDTAHVRDNADLTMFLALRIVAALPKAQVISLAPGDGAVRRIVLKPVPEELVERAGRWEVAISLAQWAAFQISIWHEIVTWYGVESVPGFSEKVSAFSPEDLYSNVLGARIAGGVLRARQVFGRAEWNSMVEAWIPATLKHLGALPTDQGRRAMKALDGRWWDSRKQLPDWTLVKRRKMEIDRRVTPWRLPDAQAPKDEVLDAACSATPTALPLDIPDRIEDHPISELVAVDFEVSDWAPPNMPFADKSSRRLTSAEFPLIVAMIHDAAHEALGPGFDQPGPLPAAPAPSPAAPATSPAAPAPSPAPSAAAPATAP